VPLLTATLDRHPYLATAAYHRALARRALARRSAGWVEGRLQRAESDLRRALALRPRWAEAWGELGRVLQDRGRVAEARAAFDRAVAFDPTHLALGRARADFLAATAGPAAGVEELRRVRRLNPRWPLAEAREDLFRWSPDPRLLERLEAAGR
jgi:tetratricopeptide (TPR) repeat protein